MFADLKNDFVFRRVFAHHPELTSALLNDLLDRQGDDRIVSLSLLSPEQAPMVAGAKLSILDLKAHDQGGRTFRVAIQMLPLEGFLHRSVHEGCRAGSGQRDSDSPPGPVDVVAVSLCDFVLVAGDGGDSRPLPGGPLVRWWATRASARGHEGRLLVQHVIVELPAATEHAAMATAAERWAWLFRHGQDLTATPPQLSDEQQRALALAEKATFSPQDAATYRRVFDEIQQARELAQGAWERGYQKGLREAVARLAEQCGQPLTEAQGQRLRGLDASELEALCSQFERLGCWPG